MKILLLLFIIVIIIIIFIVVVAVVDININIIINIRNEITVERNKKWQSSIVNQIVLFFLLLNVIQVPIQMHNIIKILLFNYCTFSVRSYKSQNDEMGDFSS